MRSLPAWRLYIFTFFLLLVACGIRSDLLVDRSFLPRVLMLSLILLITWLIVFHKRLPGINTYFSWSLLLLFLWSLVSSLWAISSAEAIMQSQLLVLSLITFLVVSSLNSQDRKFEDIFIKTQLVVLLVSFGLAFTKMALLKYFDPYKILSISANNNLYSGYLVLSLSFVFSGYCRFRGFWKYLAAIVATGSIFFIIIVQSRAGYLGFISAILIASLLLGFRYWNLVTRHSIRVAVASFVILLVSLLTFYASLDTVRRHYFLSKLPVWEYFVSYDEANLEALREKRLIGDGLNGMAEFDYAESYYENANLRLIFWWKSLHLFLDHPLLGVGAGNWRLAVPSIPIPANPDHTLKNYTYSQPHNELISIVTELGIIGFILAFGVYIFPLIIVYRKLIFSAKRPPPEVIFYTAFITGFYLFSCFDFPLKRVEHNVLLISAMAFMLHQMPLKMMKPVAIPVFIRKVIQRMVPLLLLFSMFVVVARMKGEYYTIKIFRSERKADVKVIHSCHAAANSFYRLTPNTLPIAWFEGVAHYRLGDLRQAKSCFEGALTITPYEVRVLNDYGITLHCLQDPGNAKLYLLRAIAIDSCFDDAKFNLAAIHYLSGQPDSAQFYVNRCTDSQRKDEFLEEIRSYRAIRNP